MRVRANDVARNELARQPRRGHHEHAERATHREMTERRHAAERGAAIGIHVGIGRRLRRGEHEHGVAIAEVVEVFVGVACGGAARAARSEEERDVLRKRARRVDILGHGDDRRPTGTHQRGDGHGVGTAANAGDVEARALRGARRDVREARDDDTLRGQHRRECRGRVERRQVRGVCHVRLLVRHHSMQQAAPHAAPRPRAREAPFTSHG